MDFLSQVLQPALPALATILSLALTWLVMLIAKKIKWQINEQSLRTVVDDAIGFVEEWASSRLADHLRSDGKEGGFVKSEDKLERAALFVKDRLPRTSLTERQIKEMLLARISERHDMGASSKPLGALAARMARPGVPPVAAPPEG